MGRAFVDSNYLAHCICSLECHDKVWLLFAQEDEKVKKITTPEAARAAIQSHNLPQVVSFSSS
jgi:hypothetical protein